MLEREPLLPYHQDLDEEMVVKPGPPKRELVSIAIMRKAVKAELSPNDPLNEYVDYVLPYMVERFILVSAKGGAFVEKQRAEGKSEAILARYDRDQSLLSHILNGLFPVARIIRRLQAEKAPQFRRFREQAYRLFCIGYTLHDIDKVPAIKARMEQEKLTLAANKPRFMALLEEQLQEMGLAQFFDPTDSEAYRLYLPDIAYVIANTQEVWGTYRQTFDLEVQTDVALLSTICSLTRLADHLAYLTPSPRDTASDSGDHILLDNLSNHTLQFAYHAVAENRGILTNIINSAAIAQFTANNRCEPLLFSPNGVVYLAPIEGFVPPTVETIAKAAIEKLKKVCRKQVEASAGTVGFSIDKMKRSLKEADFCQLLFSPTERLKLGVKVVEKRGRSQQFSTVANKLPEGATFPEATTRPEADMFAKFCHYAGQKVLVNTSEQTILQLFGLSDESLQTEINAWNQVDSRGGTIYRWYRAAAGYLALNPGISAEDGSFQRDLEAKVEQLSTLAGEDAADKWTTLRQYIGGVITIGWHTHKIADDLKSSYIFAEQGATTGHNFNEERLKYETAKESGKAPCSLCALPYDVQEQTETGVLFGPQVYTGRQLLHGSKLKRHICVVCRVEQLLRMVLMKNVDVQGKKFEDNKVRYVYVYPSYFFTPETLSFVRAMINALQNFKFTDVKQELVPQNSHHVNWEIANYQNLQDLLFKPQSSLPVDFEDEEIDEEAETAEPQKAGYILPNYPDDEPFTFLFFGIPHRKPPKRDITDTETWVVPTFLGLSLPMVFDTKIVVSTSPTPLFVSGADFRETVILDAPNPFVGNVLVPSQTGNGRISSSLPTPASQSTALNFPRFRLDDLTPDLQTLTAAYMIHLDAHANTSSKDFYRWGELSKVSANLASSPLYAFHYLEHGFSRESKEMKPEVAQFVKQRWSKLYIQYVEQFLKGGLEAMSIPRELTQRYRAFYRATYPLKSNGILKPIAEASDVLLKADKRIFNDDDALVEAMTGVLISLMERVHRKQAEGRSNPDLWSTDTDGKRHFNYEAERTNVVTFADYFVRFVFAESLHHDRAALAGRQLNLLKNACEAVYLTMEAEKRTPTLEEEPEETN